jgi:transcriptional regulator with XRE-family HTH domain
MENIDEIFRAALGQFLTKRGSQRKLAFDIGIDAPSLNQILKGTRAGSDNTRRKIAAGLNFEGRKYEDFLNIGRRELGLIPPETDPTFGGETVTISRKEYEDLKAAASRPVSGEQSGLPAQQYETSLGDIKDLLAVQIQATNEQTKAVIIAQNDRDKRIDEFIGHIESLKKGIEAKDSHIADLQNKFNTLLAARNTEITRMAEAEARTAEQIAFLEGQVKYYQNDGERLKTLYEEMKKELDRLRVLYGPGEPH